MGALHQYSRARGAMQKRPGSCGRAKSSGGCRSRTSVHPPLVGGRALGRQSSVGARAKEVGWAGAAPLEWQGTGSECWRCSGRQRRGTIGFPPKTGRCSRAMLGEGKVFCCTSPSVLRLFGCGGSASGGRAGIHSIALGVCRTAPSAYSVLTVGGSWEGVVSTARKGHVLRDLTGQYFPDISAIFVERLRV